MMTCESNLRKTEYIKTGCNAFNAKRQISKPLGFWTEKDIWDYIKEFNLEISEMYTKYGADRTGCYGCGWYDVGEWRKQVLKKLLNNNDDK